MLTALVTKPKETFRQMIHVHADNAISVIGGLNKSTVPKDQGYKVTVQNSQYNADWNSKTNNWEVRLVK